MPKNTAVKVISERISILKKEGLLSIVILPTTEKKKLWVMFLWLMAWTVCGVIVFANYFRLQTENEKLFVIIYLSFWAYFEFKIFRAFTWKRWGKEKLWIEDNVLHYQREINKRGKINEYSLELVQDMKISEIDEGNFFQFINQSFWVKGGEKLQFSYQSKTIRFGMQVSENEAKSLLKEVKAFLKNN